jgi:hypothetical protein
MKEKADSNLQRFVNIQMWRFCLVVAYPALFEIGDKGLRIKFGHGYHMVATM